MDLCTLQEIKYNPSVNWHNKEEKDTFFLMKSQLFAKFMLHFRLSSPRS